MDALAVSALLVLLTGEPMLRPSSGPSWITRSSTTRILAAAYSTVRTTQADSTATAQAGSIQNTSQYKTTGLEGRGGGQVSRIRSEPLPVWQWCGWARNSGGMLVLVTATQTRDCGQASWSRGLL